MAALLEKYRKVAGTGPGSTINLDDWNGLIDELSTTLAGLVKKGADFDAVATVAIGVLLDRINNVLGPAYDQVSARGAQIEALYAQISGTGISADNVIESATRLFLTDARRAAILAELRGGVPSDGDTLMELYTAIQGALTAIQAIPGDVVRYGTPQTLAAGPRIQAKANIGALGTGRAYTNAPFQVTKAHVGKVIYCDSSTTFINFDNSNTFANGDMVMVFNYGADLNVNADPNDPYSFNFGIGGVFPKTFAMKRGDRAILHMGEDHWQVIAYSVARDKALMVDRALTFSDAERQQLLTNAGLLIPTGQCRLVYQDANTIRLDTCDGNRIWLNGAYRTIPTGGVTASNTGLVAGTMYYVYALWNGSGISLNIASTSYPPTVDPTYGIKIASGSGNQIFTLVGVVYMDANGKFQDNPAQRWVVSHYGRQRKEMYGSEVSGSVGTSNVEVNSGGRISWLSLGDQAVDIGVGGQMVPSTFDNCFSNLLMDGAQVGRVLAVTLGGSGASANISRRISITPAAGLHYASLAARTSGSNATVTYQMEGAIHG